MDNKKEMVSLQDDELLVSHIDVAFGINKTQKHIKELIEKYQNDLKQLGVLRFETAKPPLNII